MKIVYDEKKTLERISVRAQYLGNLRSSRHLSYLMNFASLLILSVLPIRSLINQEPLSTTTVVLGFIALTGIICSTVMHLKNIPDITKITTPDIWYHFATKEFLLLDIEERKTDNGYSVSIVLETKKQKKRKTVELGEFAIQESFEVEEPTLDLEQGVVFVPTTTQNQTEREN